MSKIVTEAQIPGLMRACRIKLFQMAQDNPNLAALSGVIAGTQFEFSDRAHIAETDGRLCFFNPKLLTVAVNAPGGRKHLLYIVLHEILHIAYKHPFVYADLQRMDEARGWNLYPIAVDTFVNTVLNRMLQNKVLADSVEQPPYAIPPRREWERLSVTEIYTKLRQIQKDNPDQLPKEPGFDGHPMAEGDADDHRRQIDRIDQEMQVSNIAAGFGRGTEDKADALTLDTRPLRHQVPWHSVLLEALTENGVAGYADTSWGRPSRRGIARGVFQPGWVGTEAGELVVAIDVSYSALGYLRHFLAELTGMCMQLNPKSVHVLWVGMGVSQVDELTSGNYEAMTSLLHPVGGGGTDMRAGIEWVKEQRCKPAAFICLTDGETPWPAEPGFPTYWVITSRMYSCPIGTNLYIDIIPDEV